MNSLLNGGIMWFFQFICMFGFVNNGNVFLSPLSQEEEEEYLTRLSLGDEEAKRVLVERNLRLVAHIVKKYSNYQRETEDFISIGTIGLIKAVMTYKHGKGSKLVTYAARCIENEILMFIRSNKKYQNDISLQDTIGADKEGNEVTLEEKIADNSEDIEDMVSLRLETVQLYNKIDAVLTPREKRIIELRYGLKNGREVTQREIAKAMGISRSYVSRIEAKALKKLRGQL